MLEPILKDYLIKNISELNEENVSMGEPSSMDVNKTYVTISSNYSPLTDSHSSLTQELSIPKKINERVFAFTIMTQSSSYEKSANLILDIFEALGGDDGGCIEHADRQMFITPIETPFREKENLFKLNFIVRTSK